MLRLMLFRHAKADRPTDLGDHERPLSVLGREQARKMGEYIASQQLMPDMAVVSSAKRTQETWAESQDAGKLTCPVVVEPRIYEASISDLLDVVGGFDEKHRSVMLLGHNPGVERLTAYLTGSATDKALANWQKGFVVGSLALVTLPSTSWSTLQTHSGRLELFETPETIE